MACGRPCQVIARLYHVWQVSPRVGGRIPGDRTGANGEVNVASCKYPPAVVSSGSSSGTARGQVGDCSVVPLVCRWVVTVGFVRKGIAPRAVNIVAESCCHEAMVGNGIICSHGPAICGNIVNLDVKIGPDGASRDAINFAVEIGAGMEVGRDGIRGQAGVIGIADRVVAPKRGRRSEVLILAAKQVDIGAVGGAAEPGTRLRKRSDRRPGVCVRVVLVSVRDNGVINDTTEAINIATY